MGLAAGKPAATSHLASYLNDRPAFSWPNAEGQPLAPREAVAAATCQIGRLFPYSDERKEGFVMSIALRKHRAQFEPLEPRALMSSQPVAEILSTEIRLDELPEVFPTLTDAHQLTGWNTARNDYGFDGRGQTVAVIDSGIGYDHTALGGGFGSGSRVVGGWDFAEEDANPYDDGPSGSHGTHVAGIIGSTHSVHTGVAPGVDLVALRVFTDSGSGNFGWVEQALRWVHQNRHAFANPITTVNLSLGTTWNSESVPSWANLEDEFQQLYYDGIFVSVSAGNSFTRYNTTGLSYPAASGWVVPVASVDDSGQLSGFSQRSQRVIAAPGQSVMSTVPDYRGNQNGRTDDDFVRFSGTSMAAPYVAGASVVIRQALEFLGSTNIAQQTIYDWMRNTADTIYDSATNLNYQRLNLRRALDSIMPADDFGSDVQSARVLGTMPNTAVAGLIGKLSDRDYFRFTAATTGTVTVTANFSHSAVATWHVSGAGVSAQSSGATFTFNVTAGQAYTLGVGADRLGYYNLGFSAQSGSLPIQQMASILVTGAGAGGGPHVRVFDANTLQEKFGFFAYSPLFTGGVAVATADMNGDGVDDIITAPGRGGGPHIRMFDGATGAQLNTPISNFFAFESNFTGGVHIAVGDVDGDGHADLVAATGSVAGTVREGLGTRVRVFNGATGALIRQFSFGPGSAFSEGMHVAVGDVNADGHGDVIIGSANGNSSRVHVYDAVNGSLLRDFEPYGAFAGGVYVAAGDLDGDGHDEIITGAGAGGGPHVIAFDGATNAVVHSFFAYAPAMSAGVRVGAADANGDGLADLVVAPGVGGGPHVRVFESATGAVLSEMFAYSPLFGGGVFVGGNGDVSASPSSLTQPSNAGVQPVGPQHSMSAAALFVSHGQQQESRRLSNPATSSQWEIEHLWADLAPATTSSMNQFLSNALEDASLSPQGNLPAVATRLGAPDAVQQWKPNEALAGEQGDAHGELTEDDIQWLSFMQHELIDQIDDLFASLTGD
jgi:subtilisin family serine protease